MGGSRHVREMGVGHDSNRRRLRHSRTTRGDPTGTRARRSNTTDDASAPYGTGGVDAHAASCSACVVDSYANRYCEPHRDTDCHTNVNLDR
jgi:hypothetical protein